MVMTFGFLSGHAHAHAIHVRAYCMLRCAVQAESLASLPSWASGSRPPVSMPSVWPYYQGLLDKYLPQGLRW